MIIIFAGTIGQSGLGGQAWANMQYLEYKDIPFAQTKNVSSPEHSRRFACELAGYVNSGDRSQFINKERIFLPLMRCAIDGQSRHINWIDPNRILYLLQLENFTNQIFTPQIPAKVWHGGIIEGKWSDFEKTTSKVLQESGSKVNVK